MNNKKKIIAICVCVALLAGTILSGTIAYFTDKEAITNTFTSGNVMIDLEETVVDEEGNEIIVTDESNNNPYDAEFKIYPGDTHVKVPVITVGKDDLKSEKAYVASIITVTAKDLATIAGTAEYPKEAVVDANEFLKPEPLITSVARAGEEAGILNTATKCTTKEELVNAVKAGENAVFQTKSTDAEGVTTYTFYLFNAAIKNDGETVTLFNQVNVPSNWDNAEMDLLKGLTINVKAFAVQERNLDNCVDAMTAAFNDFDPVENA